MTSLPIFSDQQERTYWVQMQLKKLGLSFSAIAREHGWSRTAVRNAMYQANDAQERAIAETLGLTQRELFPERYGPRGNRKHAVKNSAAPQSHNVKSEQAA
jgi:lambda repressor-like predicted transcriptional regulator